MKVTMYTLAKDRLDPDGNPEERYFLTIDPIRGETEWCSEDYFKRQERKQLFLFRSEEAVQTWMKPNVQVDLDKKYKRYTTIPIDISVPFKLPKPKPVELQVATKITESVGEPTIVAAVPAFP